MFYEIGHDIARAPTGWSELNYIRNLNGKSFTKDPTNAQVKGLCYKIDFIKPLVEKQKLSSLYFIQFKAWNYNIYNEWHEYPVLSYFIENRADQNAPLKRYIANLKIMSNHFPIKDNLIRRVLSATSFFIKQIDNDLVPDPEQILMLYKIHPTQRHFYEEKEKKKKPLSLYNKMPSMDKVRNKEITGR